MTNYSEMLLDKIFLKSEPYSLLGDLRKDSYGLLMRRSEYGNRNSIYGWEVDHIIPLAKGGADIISNLQPLHWRNNVQKSDIIPRGLFGSSLLNV